MAAMNREGGGPRFVVDTFATNLKDSLMSNEEALEVMEDHIESKYLRYCNASEP